MRTGFTVSAIAHAALLVLVIVGIGLARPLEPQPVESIAVDLISIEDFSNIRAGQLDSTIVETETPSVVEDDQPAELAQPTGNTEEDQPTPEDTPTPTPAPTQQTAPEPVPEPVIEPEPAPEPEAQPTPAPEPIEVAETEPVEAAAPLATPELTPEPAEAAPRPVARAASLEQKRADFRQQQAAEKAREDVAKKRAEEERVREAKRQEDEAAKLADEVANIINNEESRGATTGAGGTPTLGDETGQAARLSQSQIDGLVAQIRTCMNVPAGAADQGLTVQLEFSLNQDGNVAGTPRTVTAPASPLEQALASAAQRAVMRCGPYTVAAGQDVRATFDPREF